MKHPLAIVGITIFVLSWLFLMFGARAEMFRDLVNFHKLAIGQSGIVTGIGLWIMGVLFEIRDYLLGDRRDAGIGMHTASAAVGPEALADSPKLSPEELGKAIANARAKLAQK